jgi:hypothetical protein
MSGVPLENWFGTGFGSPRYAQENPRPDLQPLACSCKYAVEKHTSEIGLYPPPLENSTMSASELEEGSIVKKPSAGGGKRLRRVLRLRMTGRPPVLRSRFRPAIVTKGFGSRKAGRSPGFLISVLPSSDLAALYSRAADSRGRPELGENEHQAHLPAQEAIPPPRPRLSSPYELGRRRARDSQPTAKGPRPADPGLTGRLRAGREEAKPSQAPE